MLNFAAHSHGSFRTSIGVRRNIISMLRLKYDASSPLLSGEKRSRLLLHPQLTGSSLSSVPCYFLNVAIYIGKVE
jgi:hypothetical protein